MNKNNIDPETIKSEVRRRYGAIATGQSDPAVEKTSSSCCGSKPQGPVSMPSCGCGHPAEAQSRKVGYSDVDLAAAPDGANLGLGCGNPVAIASLKPGQTVLDLGSGAGFDAFLAARAVGATGRVIGVDMTPEMVTKARSNAKKSDLGQVEFRLGEIEALPVADGIVDVIISNCVINLCPDKRPVYREAFRVLKPGGRLVVSDVVARGELSDEIRRDLALQCGCLAGATPYDELLAILKESGFADIDIHPKDNSREVIESWESGHGYEGRGFADMVFSAEVTARKPSGSADEKTTGCCK